MENETLSFGQYAFYLFSIIFSILSVFMISGALCKKFLLKKIEQMEIDTGQQ
ncbi:hypothetical protein P4V41_07470 [Fictibacillus nanhaiensis]|uniref:hypothetical protein n=1 Tax=Fictibacillus nanhaiensis TaxID=742169 RepID=UPI002E1A9594|nr:hypothetical protein [Fictibacillus nanhaiensis]